MAFEEISISTAEDGSVRFLQITDTHLFADIKTELLGVNTAQSFDAVIEAIALSEPRFDYVLATGDLSQDHSALAYQHFAQQIKRLQRPCMWLPGNHDMQTHMQTLCDYGLLRHKQLVSEHWQIIMLDTQVPEKPHGYLSDAQLAQLEQALQAYPDKHVLLAMHHHVIHVGSAWLDQHDVKNAKALFELIARYPRVRGIVCGHVHQNYEFQHDGVAIFSTPSTCIQFLPLSAAFALDHQQPGWRYIELRSDGSIATRVERVKGKRFLPDPKSKGY